MTDQLINRNDYPCSIGALEQHNITKRLP